MAERGRPRRFKTEEEYKQTFSDYLDKCKQIEYLPNIAGFCVFAKMDRDTFYAQKDYYSYTFKEIENMLEDAVINADINDTFKIFYMKNKFSYKDRTEIDNNVRIDNVYNELTIEELKKLANDTTTS